MTIDTKEFDAPIVTYGQTMRFEIDEVEIVRLNEWNREHCETKHDGVEPYCGAIGGRLRFCFTPTGLGTIVFVRCGLCGEEKTLTDFSEW